VSNLSILSSNSFQAFFITNGLRKTKSFAILKTPPLAQFEMAQKLNNIFVIRCFFLNQIIL